MLSLNIARLYIRGFFLYFLHLEAVSLDIQTLPTPFSINLGII